MGVDFITCSKCRETFPDCGPHDQCEKHSLCPRCMPFREGSVPDDDHHDCDGYLLAEFCPVCAAGGTELERTKDELERCRGERRELDADLFRHSAVPITDDNRMVMLAAPWAWLEQAGADRDAAEKRVEDLWELLSKIRENHMWHAPDCALELDSEKACTCGADAITDQIDALGRGAGGMSDLPPEFRKVIDEKFFDLTGPNETTPPREGE